MATVSRKATNTSRPTREIPVPKKVSCKFVGEDWLLLTQYFRPEIGAAQVRLAALVEELRAAGIHVRVLTAMPSYPVGKVFAGYRRRLWKRESGGLLRTWAWPAASNAKSSRLLNYLTFTGSALIAGLFVKKPQVLFVESQPLTLGAFALLYKHVFDVPFIYNVPDLQIEAASDLGFEKRSLALRAAAFFENYVMSQAATVSTVTPSFVEALGSRGVKADNITFLPNGTNTTLYSPRSPDPALAQSLGVSNKKVFVYVGTHAHYHGLEVLVEAARHLRHRPDVVMLLVGDGPARAALAQQVQAESLNIVFAGQIEPDRVPDVYALAWYSIATLRNIPVAKKMRLAKIFPSLSCGVPVLFSGEGETAQLLTEGSCGVSVAPEDGLALAKTIEDLSDDVQLRQRFAQNGRAFIARNYAWKTLVSNWLADLEARKLL